MTSTTANIMAERLTAMIEGLPEKESQQLLEELIDSYCLSMFGATIMEEMHKVKLAGEGSTSSIQSIANGRGILISAYGFDVKKETLCDECGITTVTIEERTEQQFRDKANELDNHGSPSYQNSRAINDPNLRRK